MNRPFKILIIRLSSLGDILHALPAFFDLRHTYPDAKIDWSGTIVHHPSQNAVIAVHAGDIIGMQRSGKTH